MVSGLVGRQATESGLAAVLFSLSGLITGLIRPEGVILAAIMLLAILFLLGWRRLVRVMATFVLIFFLLGGLYFAWRWSTWPSFANSLCQEGGRLGISGGSLWVRGAIPCLTWRCLSCRLSFWACVHRRPGVSPSSVFFPSLDSLRSSFFSPMR